MARVGARASFIWRETVLNARAFPARSLAMAFIAAIVGAGVLGFTLSDVQQIEQSYKDQQLRGINAISISASDGLGLDSSQCDAAQAISGVRAAGGILNSTRAYAAQAPSTVVTFHSVTPGYLAIMFPAEPKVWSSGVVAGSQIASALGLQNGSVLLTQTNSGADKSLRIDSTASQDGRVDGLNRDVFVSAAPVGTMTECIVEAEAGQREPIEQLLTGWFSTPQVRMQPLVNLDDLEIDPGQEFHTRLSQWTWLVGGIALFVLATFVWWSRRSDVALYAFLGMTMRNIIWMVLFEAVLLIMAPAQLGAALAVAIFGKDASSLAMYTALLDGARFLSILVLATVACVFISHSRRPIEVLKGR